MFPEVSDDVSAVEMPPFCCCVAGCGSVLQLLTTLPAKLSDPSPLTIPPVIIPPATPPLLLFVCSEPFDCPPSRGIVQIIVTDLFTSTYLNLSNQILVTRDRLSLYK
uniref:Uncharacterized protein n=1 Tax=Glossina pallidipes TaxID=7398 RepID=A0A1B0ACT9_GLOPL